MKLKAIIFLAVLALGMLPLITLIAINLRGHILRHETAAQQEILARATLNKEHLASELQWLKSSLRQVAGLPATAVLLEPETMASQQQPALDSLRAWLRELAAVQQFILWRPEGDTFLLQGSSATVGKAMIGESLQRYDLKELTPDQIHVSLMPQSLDGTPLQHPQLLLATGVSAPTPSSLPGVAIFIVDFATLLKNFQQAYWLDAAGHELQQLPPLSRPDPTNAARAGISEPFAKPRAEFSRQQPFLAKEEHEIISWFPLSVDDRQAVTFWIGKPIDMSGAQAWKRSLIVNILLIVTGLATLVFFIAELIANRIDILRNQLVNGLKGVLEREEKIVFNWRGPRELRNLAHDLSALAGRYLETRAASRQAELQLRESENKFRKLTASAQDGIIMMNHNGEVAYWNKAAETIFGYHEAEAFKQPVHSLLNLQRPELAEDAPLSLYPGRQPPSGHEILELQANHKDGRTIFIELSLSAASLQDEWHAIWIIRDVTERKRAAAEANLRQQQLIQADKMRTLGLLVSGVAHEINNPNSIALLNTPMLAKAWQSIAPIVENYYQENGDFQVAGLPYSEMKTQIPKLFLELAESGKRIRNIVKDLKDYARQDPSPHTEGLSINDIVKAAVRLTQNQLKQATDQFSVTLAEELPKIKGNRQRLEQVVINLLQNACEAVTNKAKAIAIRTYLEQGLVCLEVTDQGVGMSAQIIAQLTDPFFTTKRPQGGTGLGLSVSAGIVKEHQGQLEFQSVPEQGTSAIVRLPPFTQGIK